MLTKHKKAKSTHTPLNNIYELAEAKESKDLVLAVAVFDREYLQRKRIVYLLWQTFYKRGKRGNGALWYDVVSTFFVLNFSIIRCVLTRGEGVNKSAVPWELQRKPQARLASTETQLSFLRKGHGEGRGWWHNACLSTPTARGYTLVHSRINPAWRASETWKTRSPRVSFESRGCACTISPALLFIFQIRDY